MARRAKVTEQLEDQIHYPWHKWTDGSTWIAVPGKDFTCKIQSFVVYLHQYASSKGLKVRTKKSKMKGRLRVRFKFYEQEQLLRPKIKRRK